MARIVRYLSRTELAKRIGVKPDTLNRYALPPHDAVIGNRKGWLPSTIVRWDSKRPGRGNWKQGSQF